MIVFFPPERPPNLKGRSILKKGKKKPSGVWNFCSDLLLVPAVLFQESGRHLPLRYQLKRETWSGIKLGTQGKSDSFLWLIPHVIGQIISQSSLISIVFYTGCMAFCRIHHDIAHSTFMRIFFSRKSNFPAGDLKMLLIFQSLYKLKIRVNYSLRRNLGLSWNSWQVV